jgi:hypothetical protein
VGAWRVGECGKTAALLGHGSTRSADQPDARPVLGRADEFDAGRFKCPLDFKERLDAPARKPILLLQPLNGGQRHAGAVGCFLGRPLE